MLYLHAFLYIAAINKVDIANAAGELEAVFLPVRNFNNVLITFFSMSFI